MNLEAEAAKGRGESAFARQMSLLGGEIGYDNWNGMPSFSMADARPVKKISINFLTMEDYAEFAEKLGLKLTPNSDTSFYPQIPSGNRYVYDGPKTSSRYPICIPSKGRSATQSTGKVLDRMGVDFKFFVEECEYEEYRIALGENRVVKLPFSNLGQGSIPARNFIWDWAGREGHAKHWVVDDNIDCFYRANQNRRFRVFGGGFFNAMEDFSDRYTNLALLGPHDVGFAKDRSPTLPPFILNTRVYSCILTNSKLEHRWRGKYNEDTDLCLRALKSGWCTAAFISLLMDKPRTAGAKGYTPSGGNTDSVYAGTDNRREFAESLREQHPDVVDVTWKFNRWHHQVDYSPFKSNRLIRDDSVSIPEDQNDYEMRLRLARHGE